MDAAVAVNQQLRRRSQQPFDARLKPRPRVAAAHRSSVHIDAAVGQVGTDLRPAQQHLRPFVAALPAF